MKLLCPVCHGELLKEQNCRKCENNHSFDVAKEGYVNLLRSNKSCDNIGDNRSMALSRKSFLDKGYYSALADGLCELIPKYKNNGGLLDICCGEGYYTSHFTERLNNFDVAGFDISREMVRLAAKRRINADFFVANMTDIPVEAGSVDVATHLFAPFCSSEFYRILKKDGVLFSVVSGKNHLYELKQVLYEKPYFNDEAPPVADGFILKDKVKIKDKISVNGNDDIMSLLKMTPYYYHTPTSGLKKLSGLKTLETELEFVIFVYGKE